MGCHFLLQGVFLTQESNLGLLHCRKTLQHLSHLNVETRNVNWCSLCGNSAEIPQQAERRVHVTQQPRFWELMLILCDEVTLGRSPRLEAGFRGTHRERRWISGPPQRHRAAWWACEPHSSHSESCRFTIAITKILK